MNLVETEQDIMGDKTFRLTGTAVPKDARWMLDEVCDHFVEHAAVERSGNVALLTSPLGTASFEHRDDRLLISLACSDSQSLQLTQNSIAEHLFYFAGEDPLELTWSAVSEPKQLPNFREVTVVRTQTVTPNMRRVVFRCNDVTPFVGAGMHVRILVPPKGRQPVWPTTGADGRLVWPKGEDELLVRVYTIREVDEDRRELSVDFLQHPAPGVQTPGADFARYALPGETVGFLGPGGGDMPRATKLLLCGDESALPAIARIAAEAPAGTRIQAIIEVHDASEEQQLPSQAALDLRWLHRASYAPNTTNPLVDAARAAIRGIEADAFVWVACEKEDLRLLRAFLKERGHNRKLTYAAWYWEREAARSAHENA